MYVFLVRNDLAANTDQSSCVDAKSIAEVNDIIEHIFLVTLNRGLFNFICTACMVHFFSLRSQGFHQSHPAHLMGDI